MDKQTKSLLKRCDVVREKIDELITEVDILKYQLEDISLSDQEFQQFKKEFYIPVWEEVGGVN